MTFYTLKEYIKYRWKAQTRHGVHSPFVYDFIENVLMNKEMITSANEEYVDHFSETGEMKMSLPGVSGKYIALINCIISYYNKANDLFPEKPVFIFRNAIEYNTLINETCLRNFTLLIVTNIHATTLSTSNWLALCKDSKVILSIDLFQIGLLFFREEFKEKQHFVLKY